MKTQAIPPRPTTQSECTCIWRALDEERQRLAEEKQQQNSRPIEAAQKSSLNPLNHLPGGFFTHKDENDEDHHVSPEQVTEHISRPAQPPVRRESRGVSSGPTVVGLAPAAEGAEIGLKEDPVEGIRRAEKKSEILKKKGKGLAGKNRPDVVIRAFKKKFSQSSENKIAELVSYREDLTGLLQSLIPVRRVHDPHTTHPPVVTPIPHTYLCSTCLTTLTSSLYYSPARTTPYIRDHSTSLFLTLLDDAYAALTTNTKIEPITHHTLDTIFRSELAAVEWRISVKLARYHKRTGFLEMFPVRIGEFAQMEVNTKPPGQPEGLFKKAGKKVLGAVGLGGAEVPKAAQGAVETSA